MNQQRFDFLPVDKERDERPCAACGRPILTITTAKYIASEFCDRQGRCWDCNRNDIELQVPGVQRAATNPGACRLPADRTSGPDPDTGEA